MFRNRKGDTEFTASEENIISRGVFFYLKILYSTCVKLKARGPNQALGGFNFNSFSGLRVKQEVWRSHWKTQVIAVVKNCIRYIVAQVDKLPFYLRLF